MGRLGTQGGKQTKRGGNYLATWSTTVSHNVTFSRTPQKSVLAEEAHFINTKQLKFLLARSRWQVSQAAPQGCREDGLEWGVVGAGHRWAWR